MPSIIDTIGLLSDFFEGKSSWLTYLIVIIIPFAVVIALREIYCWFNKINKVVYKLDNLSKSVDKLNIILDDISISLRDQNIALKKPISPPSNTPSIESKEDWTK